MGSEPKGPDLTQGVTLDDIPMAALIGGRIDDAADEVSMKRRTKSA
jgi:hypothetical protein